MSRFEYHDIADGRMEIKNQKKLFFVQDLHNRSIRQSGSHGKDATKKKDPEA